MRIMWNSVAPWVPTGYGTQTKQVVQRLLGAGCPVYPADHTGLQKQTLKYHVNHWAAMNGWDPDTVLVITLFDVHTWINPRFGGILANFKGLNQTAWVPVDHQTLPVIVEGALKEYDVMRPIAMSKFGHERLLDAGFDALYVPHAIDTAVFEPKDKLASRPFLSVPEDRFVIGMVANNSGQTPPRKAFPQVMEAFKRFHATHDDALLYLHTEMFGFYNEGLNLVRVAEWFDIPPDSIAAVDQAAYSIGIPDEAMAHVYSAMDVLVNPSYGEGFGVPIVEAQACGVPVIVNDSTAMPELVGSGWVCDGELTYDPTQMAMWKAPSVESIVDCFEQAYEARGDQQRAVDARLFALEYDADRVFETYWEPTLAKLDGPREVPPLVPLNRAQRRRMARAA